MRKKKNKRVLRKRSKAVEKRWKRSWRQTHDSREALNLAIACHKKGETQQAADRYKAILDNDPEHADALHLLGVLMSQQGAHEKAIRLIQKAIQKFPTSEICYNNLANALFHGGRSAEAMETYRQALEINPRYFDAYNNMGNTAKQMGQPLEAIGYYKKALEIKPDSAKVRSDMGNVLAEIGQIDEALELYAAAIKVNPNYAKAYNNMGSALKAKELYTEAIDYYCKAVETDPLYAEAFNNIGATITDMGKPAEAVKFFQKALELKPDSDLFLVNLYDVLKRICDWNRLDSLEKKLDGHTNKALVKGFRPIEDPFLNLARHDDPALNYAVAKS
jgi:superkiller protein 3